MDFETITLKKENITDFAGERNRLVEKSNSEWIFFLDSDERFSPELKTELKKLSPGDYRGFVVLRNNYFLGKFIGTDRLLRLARKDSGKWQRSVHETWNVRGKTGRLKGFITHQTAKSLSEYLRKLNSYSSIHAKENLKAGKRSDAFKIAFYPPLKFLQSLVMGRGFVFSMLQSFHSFLAWSKEWDLQKK